MGKSGICDSFRRNSKRYKKRLQILQRKRNIWLVCNDRSRKTQNLNRLISELNTSGDSVTITKLYDGANPPKSNASSSASISYTLTKAYDEVIVIIITGGSTNVGSGTFTYTGNGTLTTLLSKTSSIYNNAGFSMEVRKYKSANEGSVFKLVKQSNQDYHGNGMVIIGIE